MTYTYIDVHVRIHLAEMYCKLDEEEGCVIDDDHLTIKYFS